LTPEITLWKFKNPLKFQLPKWELLWECEGSFPHTLLHSQEHDMWLPSSVLAHTLISPYLGHEPKAKVVITFDSKHICNYVVIRLQLSVVSFFQWDEHFYYFHPWTTLYITLNITPYFSFINTLRIYLSNPYLSLRFILLVSPCVPRILLENSLGFYSIIHDITPFVCQNILCYVVVATRLRLNNLSHIVCPYFQFYKLHI
jgi:hypothetical protein